MLEFPWAGVAEGSLAREVAPGVVWIRMPMPGMLDHVNLWAIRDGGTADAPAGWTLVDTGMHTPATVEAWQALLAPAGPLSGAPVTRIVVTHMHIDHVGMAGWLTRFCRTRLWMTRLEFMGGHLMAGDAGRQASQDEIAFYRRAGWDEQQIANYCGRFGTGRDSVHPLPGSYRRIRHDETLRIGDHEWRVIVGDGHSREHACLHCQDLKLFISGDQVLPGITSNVSVHPDEPDADPLRDWLASIERIRRMVPDDVLVLPAHKLPFRGLHERLQALDDSVRQALDRLRVALAAPKRVTDLFTVLFARPIEGQMLLGLATGEALAHLNHLLERGEIVSSSGPNGVTLYATKRPENSGEPAGHRAPWT